MNAKRVIIVISYLCWDSNYIKCRVKWQGRLVNLQRHVYINDNELYLINYCTAMMIRISTVRAKIFRKRWKKRRRFFSLLKFINDFINFDYTSQLTTFRKMMKYMILNFAPTVCGPCTCVINYARYRFAGWRRNKKADRWLAVVAKSPTRYN